MAAQQFTVFTPTYNRAHLLPRLYDSLLQQSFDDFEWLIIDDGSSDQTQALVERYISDGRLNIRYFRQATNSGKHAAINAAVERSEGELFLTIDSDDYLMADGLEIFHEEWDRIEDKGAFCSVCCLCQDVDGRLIGSAFPEDVLDSDSMEIRQTYGVTGDNSGFTRTDVYRGFPYPVFEGERFLTEAVVDDLVATKYKTRFVNRIVVVKEYQEAGLSDASLQLRIDNPLGTLHHYQQSIDVARGRKAKLRHASNYLRFSFHSDIGIPEALRRSTHKLATLVTAPLGYALYLADLRRGFRRTATPADLTPASADPPSGSPIAPDPISLDPISLDPNPLDPIALDQISLDPTSLDPASSGSTRQQHPHQEAAAPQGP